MTIVALPLFKLELSFLVRHGRRWTAFEHLLLWAVSQDARSLDDLRRGTNMPQRLVIEGLINLLKVGWIELTTIGRGTANGVLFTANSRGRSIVAEHDLPYAWNAERRFATLLVERMTGHVIKVDQVEVRHIDQISQPATVVLQPSQDKYAASPAHFSANLKLRSDERFERPLDHRVASLAHYAMLDVVGDHVGGLPDDAPAHLTEAILRHMPGSGRTSPTRTDSPTPQASRPLTAQDGFAPTVFEMDDLLVGGGAHKRELKRMLRDAKRVVFIHSTFIGKAIEQVVPELVAAAERKVDVFMLWGERRDSAKHDPSRSEIAGRLAYAKIPAEARERIRLAVDPTGSHAKVLLADSGPDGAYEAVLGSCNWLSATYMALELSVRLREPRLVRRVAGVLADMSRPNSGAWGREVTMLLRIQDECRLAEERQRREDRQGTKAMIIMDNEHYAAIRDVRNASARSVVVGCDLFGPAARTTVFEPLSMAARDDGTTVEVLFNQPTDGFEEQIEAVVADFRAPSISVAHCPGLHGKFLVWNDETLIVTSFNWLSASVKGGGHAIDELGVLIHDAALVPRLVQKLRRVARIEENPMPGKTTKPTSEELRCPTP